MILNKSDILKKKNRKILYLCSINCSLIQSISLSPRSFLKSYLKIFFFKIYELIRIFFRRDVGKFLGKVNFNETDVLLKITEKGVKEKWVREIMIDQIA